MVGYVLPRGDPPVAGKPKRQAPLLPVLLQALGASPGRGRFQARKVLPRRFRQVAGVAARPAAGHAQRPRLCGHPGLARLPEVHCLHKVGDVRVTPVVAAHVLPIRTHTLHSLTKKKQKPFSPCLQQVLQAKLILVISKEAHAGAPAAARALRRAVVLPPACAVQRKTSHEAGRVSATHYLFDAHNVAEVSLTSLKLAVLAPSIARGEVPDHRRALHIIDALHEHNGGAHPSSR